MNFLAQKRKKILLHDSHNSPPTEVVSLQPNDSYFQEIAQLTAAGGWLVNLVDKAYFIDNQARKILNIPKDIHPTFNSIPQFYSPEFKQSITKACYNLSEGVDFCGVVKLIRYDKLEVWVNVTATPIFDDNNEVVGIRGIMQDVTETKLKEIDFEKRLIQIETQNKRLVSLASKVSYKLKCHANNLHLTAELLGDALSFDEEPELKNGLREISKNITTTINHLNETVSMQSKALGPKSTVSFKDNLLCAMQLMQDDIFSNEVEIYSDFSEVTHIVYHPSTLESIFLNLISNTIKFRHPSRKPVIDIYTYEDEGVNYLMFKDNGQGIDLKKYRQKIFNLYETFHDHPDSVGIGLYDIKNQIEALNGTIEIESAVNIGTTFLIKF